MQVNSIESSSTQPHAVLILAAGESERLGSSKQLLLKQGIPLVRYIVEEALKTNPIKVVVVIGSQALKTDSVTIVKESSSAPAVRDALKDLPISFAVNPAPNRGMSSSLKIGAAALNKHHGRILILCVDQPRLALFHLERLIEAGRIYPNAEIVSSYAETFGMPVFIHSRLLVRSHELTGDVGLKRLLKEQSEKLICIPSPDLEFDIDNEEDLQFARNKGWIE